MPSPSMRVTGSFSLGTEGKLRYQGRKSWEMPKYPLVLRRASSLGKVRGKHRTWHIVGCSAGISLAQNRCFKTLWN